MISSASVNLFLKTANVLLPKGKSFPRHAKPNAECIVMPLTLNLQLQKVLEPTLVVSQERHHGIEATLLLTYR